MNKTGDSPHITLRIPGAWLQPMELRERLPEGFRLSSDALLLPDGTEIEFNPLEPDEHFSRIFKSACRRSPNDDELDILARYSVIIGLSGPSGSMKSALAMMQAGAAFVKAGGAGVFIDNCALAYGGRDWIAMTDDGGPEAISFAFVAIVRGQQEVSTIGMQVMGFPDILMSSSDVDEKGAMIVEIIRYICSNDRPIEIGHFLADEIGPRFQVVSNVSDKSETQSPMHNPLGRLKIVSIKDIAEGN